MCNKNNLNLIHWACDCPSIKDVRTEFGLEVLNAMTDDKLGTLFDGINDLKLINICKYIVKVLELVTNGNCSLSS